MILFTIFLSIIFIYFFKGKKQLLDIKKTRILQIVHLLTILLVCLIIYLKQFDISLRGYITEKIIYWLFYFSALILLVFGNPLIVKGIQRIYYFIYLFTPILLVFTLVIPFLGLGLIFSLQDEFFGDAKAVKYSDKNFRLEMPFTGILGNSQSPILIVKKGLFEYEDQGLQSINSNQVDEYKIIKQSKSIISIQTKGISFPEIKPSLKTVKVYLKHQLD